MTQQVLQHPHKCYLFIRGFARVGACVYGGGLSLMTPCVSVIWWFLPDTCKETQLLKLQISACVCSPPHPPTLPHTKGQKKLFVVSYSSKAQWNPTEVLFLFPSQFHPASPPTGKAGETRLACPVLQAQQPPTPICH